MARALRAKLLEDLLLLTPEALVPRCERRKIFTSRALPSSPHGYIRQVRKVVELWWSGRFFLLRHALTRKYPLVPYIVHMILQV